jgi:tRNA-dihydrouridine synthase
MKNSRSPAVAQLARGALGNPWLFAQLLGTREDEPTRAEILAELQWVSERRRSSPTDSTTTVSSATSCRPALAPAAANASSASSALRSPPEISTGTDLYEEITLAEPDNRRRLSLLMMAITAARTPDVPVPYA